MFFTIMLLAALTLFTGTLATPLARPLALREALEDDHTLEKRDSWGYVGSYKDVNCGGRWMDGKPNHLP